MFKPYFVLQKLNGDMRREAKMEVLERFKIG